MGPTVCLQGNMLYYPEGGGHAWAYLNWALGFRALGCRVLWLEFFDPKTKQDRLENLARTLKNVLDAFGLGDALALSTHGGRAADLESVQCMDLSAATDAELLFNLQYGLPQEIVGRFRRSALLDIDPGQLQVWIASGSIKPAKHDLYLTIGEGINRPGSRVPSCGLEWHFIPPCVSVEHWPVIPAPEDAPFTTVSHWEDYKEWFEWNGESYANEKRAGFEPFFDLPSLTKQPLELAIYLGDDDPERENLARRGWRVRHSPTVASTPQSYQQYIQHSRGEFSCCKPSYVKLQTGWVSDRTICYLASGRPAVVQHTGPSDYLPDAAGLFRFRTPDEAARHLDAIAADYPRQSRLARQLAEEYFAAPKVAGKVLEMAIR